MIVTLEKAPVGSCGTLVEEIWNIPAGAGVEVLCTPWKPRQETCVRVLLQGQGYTKDLPYWVKIDDGRPSTLGEALSRQEEDAPQRLRDILRPIVQKLVREGMDEDSIPHELFEKAAMILNE